MRILVIGPGALGIVTAVRLHQAGHDVFLAVRDAAKAKALAGHVRMTDPKGRLHEAPVHVVHRPKDAPDMELIIHTTKLQVAENVAKKWLPCLARDGWFVPFQNGVEGDAMAGVVGDRLLECSVYWPATLVDVGHSHQTGPGILAVGPWPSGDAGPDSPAASVADVLSAVTPAMPRGDMEAVKWSKLILNSAATSLGVVTGHSLATMMKDRATREAVIAVVREGRAVMQAQGIPVVNLGATRVATLSSLPTWAAHLALKALGRKYRNYRSSSAQSLQRGQKTEVDYLNGRIVTAGKALGVPTPVNQSVLEIIHAIEAGQKQSGLDLIGRLAAQAPPRRAAGRP